MKRIAAFVFALAVAVASLVSPSVAWAADYLVIDGVVARPQDQAAAVFEGYGWTYDGENELVLSGYDGGGIRFAGQLNITLEGSNTINGTVEEYDSDTANAYWIEATPFWGGMPELLIQGGGSLAIDLDGVNDSRVSSGSGVFIYEGGLTIDGSSVAVIGGEGFGSNGSGVNVWSLELKNRASASIERGVIVDGLVEGDGLTMVDSMLEVAAIENPAIFVSSHVTVRGSTIQATTTGAAHTTFHGGGGFSLGNEAGDTKSVWQGSVWEIKSSGSGLLIYPCDVDIAEASVAVENQTYTGNALTPEPIVTHFGRTLTKGTDYTLSFSNNVNAGTATVTVTGIGSFVGSTSATFAIKPADISKATVSAPVQTYSGDRKTPTVAVYLDGRTLKTNVDYTGLTYTNNVNAGTANVSVTGRGNYTGTAQGLFIISPLDITYARVSAPSQTYDGTPKKPVPTVQLDRPSVSVPPAGFDAVYENNVEIGSATIRVTGKGNYTGAARGTFEIVDTSRIMSASVALKTVTVFDTQRYEIVMGPGKPIKSIKLSIGEREETLTSNDGKTFRGSWYVGRDSDSSAYSIYFSGDWQPAMIVVSYVDGTAAAVYDFRQVNIPKGSAVADLSGLDFTFVDENKDVVPVYRLYNKKTSEHLYTINYGEFRDLPKITKGDWVQEGIAWYAPKKSKTPVYRLYNKKSGDHHYTTSKQEADTLVKRHGWTLETTAFYSDDARRVPLYRLYNGRLQRGQHHYTADSNERSVLSSKHGWKYETIGFYGVGR